MANPDSSFFDEIDEAAEMAADARAMAEMDLKGGVPHAEVRAWLDTWGMPNEPSPTHFMVEVSWSPQAIRDLLDISRYIGRDSPLAAQRMAVRLKAAGDSLSLTPERGRPASGGAREIALIYPYLIRYRTEPKLVRILRIKHGAQRPG